MQTRLQSMAEVALNYIIAITIAYLAQTLYLSGRGIEMQTQHQLELVAIMTIVSIIRAYAIRRYFNYRTMRSNNDSKLRTRT